MPIDNILHLNKRALYTSDLIAAGVYIAYGKYVNTFTTLSEFQQFIDLNYDSPNTHYTIMGDNPF